MIELASGRARARVDPRFGARVCELVIDGVPVLVAGDPEHDDALDWGLYPMVPFAGRLRDGRLDWRGTRHRFPLRRPPHAIHGTVLDARWTVDRLDASSCTCSTSLVDPWPFPGRVTHSVDLTDDRLDLALTVRADVDMPVQIGWHPWFRKPSATRFPFDAIHPRDADGIADAVAQPLGIVPWGDVDDCFRMPIDGLDDLLTITIDGCELMLTSSCRHWVVYDRPMHATCVEPQSGPPNRIAHDPVVVPAGSSIRETFSIRWAR